MFILVIFILIDGLQAIISGLIRAVGRESNASITFILCYLILGEIVGYFLFYPLNLKLNGIWIGMSIGALVYDIILFINLIWRDWNEQVELIEKNNYALHQLQIQLLLNENEI